MPMNKINQIRIAGANALPTLSVPNLWTEKKIIKIATDIPTTTSVKFKLSSNSV